MCVCVCGCVFMCVLQIEQYAVDFVQHQMDPPFALDASDAEQVLNSFVDQ